jgi:hemolysin activation/secretion protein
MMMRPFTFAVRGLHFGRYGGDAGSDRLSPLFVGQPHLVRGYDANSFVAGECRDVTVNDECPQLSRLSGSRVAVINAEFRIPLFGTRQFGLIPFSILPLEISPFVDAGLAWSKANDVSLRFARQTAERVPVVSAGVSGRMNLLGYAVLEVFYARPFQRPTRGGLFGFQLQPGW